MDEQGLEDWLRRRGIPSGDAEAMRAGFRAYRHARRRRRLWRILIVLVLAVAALILWRKI